MDTDATPVTLDVDPALGSEVRGWVESLGWQIIDAETAALVPPVLLVTDPHGTSEPGPTPTVLLVRDSDDPAAAATRACHVRAASVLRWPEERASLAATVGPVADADARTGGRVLRISGAAGGVGTTTIALALGGLAAWRGRATLVVARGDVPVADARSVDPSVLRGPGAWRAGTPVPGVPGLRVVAATAPVQADPEVSDAALVLVDGGDASAADVLVLRRDGAGLRALAASAAGTAVVVDHGPGHPRDLVEAAAGRRVISVPYSARVARAGLARRVPAGIPGAWLRLLAPVAREL